MKLVMDVTLENGKHLLIPIDYVNIGWRHTDERRGEYTVTAKTVEEKEYTYGCVMNEFLSRGTWSSVVIRMVEE